MSIDTALIHRARAVGWVSSGVRDAQGAYGQVASVGPWIPARVMSRGGVAAEARGLGGEARVVRSYELLLGPEDENSDAVDPPTASSRFETDTSDGAGDDVLGSPTLELSGEPDVLTNGEDLIGFMAYGDVPLERS